MTTANGGKPSVCQDLLAPGAEHARLRMAAQLLQQTTQPLSVVDLEGRIIYANAAFERLVGYSSDELQAMTYRDLTPPRFLPVSDEALKRLHESGQAERYEKVYVHKDGHEIPIELVTDFYRDETGQPCGFYAFITDITERKRGEQALRESEERFRRLYDEAPFGYHEVDVEGRIVIINRTECEMLGYRPEDMIGRSISDFMTQDQREASLRAIRERVQGGDEHPYVERMFLTREGNKLHAAIETRVNRDDQGRITGLRSTVQDITWRKQAEEALVASERRARALFEGIEDAVFVHDMQGRIINANPAACRRLGYTRHELLQLKTQDIDDPDFANGFEDRLSTQLREGHLRCEGRHRTKDGQLIPVDINTSTIQWDDGRMVVLAVIRDITERKALEETRRQFAEAQLKNAWEIEAKNRALRLSESRYRQLTEGCLDAIIVTDPNGRISLFNAAAERTFGYTAQEAIGMPLIELMPEDLRGDLVTGLQDYLQTRDGQLVGRTVELRGRRKDGEVFPLEISLSAIEFSGELQFLGAIRDQGERQRMRAQADAGGEARLDRRAERGDRPRDQQPAGLHRQ